LIFFFFRYILLRSPKLLEIEPDGQSYSIFSSTETDGSDPKNLYPDIIISQTFDVEHISDNYFSNFWQSVIAVYFWINGRWDQMDQWNYLQIQILCLSNNCNKFTNDLLLSHIFTN